MLVNPVQSVSSSTPSSPPPTTVRCGTTIVPFGQCLHRLVTGTEPSPVVRVRVQWNVDTNMLVLDAVDGKDERTDTTTTVEFEHAKPCPAEMLQEWGWTPPSKSLSSGIRIGVAVLVQDETNRFLMTRRNPKLRSFPNAWVLPGGHVERGETLNLAAAREVWEEVGVQLHPEWFSLLGVWESTYPHMASFETPITHHHVVLYFIAKMPHPLTTLHVQASEVAELTLLSADHARKLLLAPKTQGIEVPMVSVVGTIVKEEHDAWENKTEVSMLNCDDNHRGMLTINDVTYGTQFAIRKWLERIDDRLDGKADL